MKALTIILVSIVLFSNTYGQSYSMKVSLKNKTSVLIPITDIKNITFSNLTNVKETDLEKSNLIKSIILLQNYPNPFNPTTTISYQLLKSGNVEIKIFDLNSKCIKTLLNRVQSEGVYNILWDSKDDFNNYVTSGVYLYQIRFYNQTIHKMMLLIK